MWRVVLLAFSYHVVSQAQPATDEPSPRLPRELIECCPCPRKGPDMLDSQSRMVDDCPCRPRSADSDGASSMLAPTRSGPGRRLNSVPFMRSNTPKDDLKNLLEPEVGLAASMLETLREATEEEYQYALARDAARDAVPEESRNVVIIVKPRSNNDFVPEASDLKEARIHPLGRALTISKPLRTLPNILSHNRQPSYMNSWDRDSNVGASNVQNSIVEKNGDELPRLFRFRTPFKDALRSSTIGQNHKVLDKFGPLKDRPNIFERFNLPLIPKMKVDIPLRKTNNLNTNNDLSTAPSNIEQIEDSKENRFPKFNKRPLLLNNLLNLRDVESIPREALKRPLFKSQLLKNDISSNKDDCDSSYDSEMNEKVLLPEIKQAKEELKKHTKGSESFQNIDQRIEENSQDALTSPSESFPAIETFPRTISSGKIDCNDLPSDDIISSTTESLTKALQDDTESSEILDPTQLSEIEDVTKNKEESSNSRENNESAENEGLNMRTDKNKKHNIPFNEKDIEETNFLPEYILPDLNPKQERAEPSDNTEDHISHDKIKNIKTTTTEAVPIIKTIPPIVETLAIIQDNLRNSFENLRSKSLRAPLTKSEKNENAPFSQNIDEKLIGENLPEVDNFDNGQKKATDQVFFKELQEKSNDLLVLSSNNEQSLTQKEVSEEQLSEENKEERSNSRENNRSADNEGLNMRTDKNKKHNIPFNEQDIEETNLLPEYILPDLNPKQERAEPSDNTEDDISHDKIKNIKTTTTEAVPIIKTIPPIVETLAIIQDNLRNSFENLRSKSLRAPLTKIEKKGNAHFSQNIDKKLIGENLPEVDNFDNGQKEATADQVAFKKLQEKSNDLLVLSSNNEQSLTQKEVSEEQLSEENNKTFPVLDERISNFAEPTKSCIVSDPFKTKQSKSATNDVSFEDHNSNDMSSEASAPCAKILPALLDPLNLNDNSEPSMFQNFNPLDPLNLNEKLRSINILDPLNLSEKLRSPVLPNLDPLNLNDKLLSPLLPIMDPLNLGSEIQDILVQPNIQNDPLNLITKPIAEVLKLPTLEDLRDGLESVFNTNQKSARNNFSDKDEDCTDDVPKMASAASNTNLRVPSLTPLEDLNVDLFQLNPLSPSQKVLSKVPRLDLKNFRTKLPVPTNLELKPVKLESRVANNKGNVLGASLTFGDKTASRKAKPQLNLLGKPLGTLPSFDELRNTLHYGAQNLLGSSSMSNLDSIRNSHLQSSGLSDIDEFRRNAENTIKGLQQRMRSSLNGKGINSPLNEFARPQDLLEDVNDKLKAIHYDLNDRISSIHEDLLDKSRIQPLKISTRIPTFPNGRNSNHKELNTIRKIKAKPSRLQTSASTISSIETDTNDNENENSVMRFPARNSLKRLHINPHRGVVGAESSPVLTKVEPPKPRTLTGLPKKSILPSLPQRLPFIRQGSENIKEKPLTLLKQPSLKDLKRPFIRKPSPFIQEKTNKVTITFATTTPTPITSPTGSLRTTPSTKTTKTGIQERLVLPRSRTLGSQKFITESTPLRMSTPEISKNNFKIANINKDLPQLQNTDLIDSTKSRLLNSKGLRDDNLRFNNNNADKLKSTKLLNNTPEIKKIENKPQIKPLVWPKSSEDSFLSKVREAMQARLASFDPKNTAKGNIDTEKTGNPNIDMLKSATENNDVLVEAPLKESVPYKCRLVCTRE